MNLKNKLKEILDLKNLEKIKSSFVNRTLLRVVGRLHFLFSFEDPILFREGEFDRFILGESDLTKENKKKLEDFRNIQSKVHLFGALEDGARFERLPLSEMQTGNMLIGDVYLSLTSGKKVRVGFAGDRFPENFLEKVKKTHVAVIQKIPYWKEVRDTSVREFLTDINLERENGKLFPGERSGFTILRWLSPSLSGSPRCPELHDLMSFAEGVCGPHPQRLVRALEKGDVKILKRGTKVAALGVHLAILLGYYELELLKLIWNIFIFLDSPLAFEKFKSRLEVTDAVTSWANRGFFDVRKFSETEKKKLKNHTARATAFMRIQFREEFENHWDHQLKVLPMFHHENQKGRGPLHVESGRLMELERLAAYADALADAEEGDWFQKLNRMSRHEWGGLCPVLGNRLLSVWGRPDFLEVPEDELGDESKVQTEVISETEEIFVSTGENEEGEKVA